MLKHSKSELPPGQSWGIITTRAPVEAKNDLMGDDGTLRRL